VQVHARGGLDQGLELGQIGQVLGFVDSDRADHVQRAALGAEAVEGPHGQVEGLVGLDEPDGQEDQLVVGEAERAPGRVPGHGGAADEVGAVGGDGGALGPDPERLDHVAPLQLGVQLDALDPPPQPAGGRPVGAAAAPDRVVDLVDDHLGAPGRPDRGQQGQADHGVADRGGRDGIEDVGVELDDDLVVAADPAGQHQRPPGAVQVEVVVGGRRAGREHLDLVALAAQGGHRLDRVGGDPVPDRRVGGHHQDAHAPAPFQVQVVRAASTLSSTVSHW
jgi:hypothetical protein